VSAAEGYVPHHLRALFVLLDIVCDVLLLEIRNVLVLRSILSDFLWCQMPYQLELLYAFLQVIIKLLQVVERATSHLVDASVH
jgi:hypothetical protein